MNMQDRKTINTFSLRQPVSDQVVELQLCLFASPSPKPGSRQFTFSIVGKVSGLTCTEGIAKVIAEYDLQKNYTDELSIINNQFVYCNQCVDPVMLEINLQLKAVLSWQGVIQVNFQVILRYSLNKFSVYSINSSYSTKSKTKPKFTLMQ